VFQLTPSKRRAGVETVPEEYLGRLVGIDGLTYATLDERTRQGWRVRGSGSGARIDDAVGEDRFIPIVRVIDGRMAFLCRNDPMPTEGDVIGLAAPSLQRELDDDAAADEETDPVGVDRPDA
jgi:hypothetical protein